MAQRKNKSTKKKTATKVKVRAATETTKARVERNLTRLAKKRQAKADRFLKKIVGDSGEKILHKTMREIGVVGVAASRADGYTATIHVEPTSKFTGKGKSLAAAVRGAVKAWAAAQ